LKNFSDYAFLYLMILLDPDGQCQRRIEDFFAGVTLFNCFDDPIEVIIRNDQGKEKEKNSGMKVQKKQTIYR